MLQLAIYNLFLYLKDLCNKEIDCLSKIIEKKKNTKKNKTKTKRLKKKNKKNPRRMDGLWARGWGLGVCVCVCGGGGGAGGETWGKSGTGVRVSISKPSPFIHHENMPI